MLEEFEKYELEKAQSVVIYGGNYDHADADGIPPDDSRRFL